MAQKYKVKKGDEVIVTTRKREENLQSVPIAVDAKSERLSVAEKIAPRRAPMESCQLAGMLRMTDFP